MSEFGEMPRNPENMAKGFSQKDKELLKKFGVATEKQAQEPTPHHTHAESYLRTIFERQESDDQTSQRQTEAGKGRKFDLIGLFRAEIEDFKSDQEAKRKRPESANTLDELTQMQEGAVKLAANQPINPDDQILMLAHVTDRFDSWRATSMQSEDLFAHANARLYGEFRNILYGAEISTKSPPVYPEYQVTPKDTAEMLKTVKEKEAPDLGDVQTFLTANEQDRERAEALPHVAQFAKAVTHAREFVKAHAADKGENKCLSVRTNTNGEVKVTWQKTPDRKQAEPLKGKYIFDLEAGMDDPLSFARAEYTVDSYAFRKANVEKARASLKKIEKNEKITLEEELAIYQVLEEHRQTQMKEAIGANPPDTGIDQDALTKLVNFVGKKLGKNEREKSPTKDTLAFAKDFAAHLN